MAIRQCKLDDCAQKLTDYILDKRIKRHSVVGFCAKYYIPKSTFYSWVDRDDNIKELSEICKVLQEHEVSDGALTGELNAVMSRLILSTNHGYTERVESHGRPPADYNHDPAKVVEEMKKEMSKDE